MANPSYLLKTPLEPSRGSNSDVYSLFDLTLGVFDLAGQENENWFNKDKNIFNQANMVISVLDINNYLKDLLSFFESLSEIYGARNLNNCQLIILLHKIDIIDPLYLHHKMKVISDYIDNELHIIPKPKIYTTSIAKDFFFQTYNEIMEIIMEVFENKSAFMNNPGIQDYRLDLEIIMQYDISKKIRISDLFHDLKLPQDKANFHLRRLEKLGFIKFLDTIQEFQLTEKADFFKNGLEKEDEKKSKMNKILESLYISSNINPQIT